MGRKLSQIFLKLMSFPNNQKTSLKKTPYTYSKKYYYDRCYKRGHGIKAGFIYHSLRMFLLSDDLFFESIVLFVLRPFFTLHPGGSLFIIISITVINIIMKYL
jgi:hypothetical protein